MQVMCHFSVGGCPLCFYCYLSVLVYLHFKCFWQKLCSCSAFLVRVCMLSTSILFVWQLVFTVLFSVFPFFEVVWCFPSVREDSWSCLLILLPAIGVPMIATINIPYNVYLIIIVETWLHWPLTYCLFEHELFYTDVSFFILLVL